MGIIVAKLSEPEDPDRPLQGTVSEPEDPDRPLQGTVLQPEKIVVDFILILRSGVQRDDIIQLRELLILHKEGHKIDLRKGNLRTELASLLEKLEKEQPITLFSETKDIGAWTSHEINQLRKIYKDMETLPKIPTAQSSPHYGMFGTNSNYPLPGSAQFSPHYGMFGTNSNYPVPGSDSIQSSKDTKNELPCYVMDKKPRGKCIIINVEKFGKNETRTGSQHDKALLESVFRDKLHFTVDCHDNPTGTEMTRCLVEISHNIDHKDFDCFVCCILSHGDLGHVLGSDDKAVAIKELTSIFNANRCPSLAGKPKLFFIQACQGKDRMSGVPVPTGIQKDACREETIPLEADFLFGYSTVPGHVSYREPESGSWYIRALCSALTEFHDRCHLLEILTAVNATVAQESEELMAGVYKQIPAPQTTLTKLLYFR